VLRLMMSRLSSHLCPNGHCVGSSVATQGEELRVCGLNHRNAGGLNHRNQVMPAHLAVREPDSRPAFRLCRRRATCADAIRKDR
jgi:hypothetical protein